MECRWIIRKADLDDALDVSKVHVDSWRTTYKGIVDESFLDNLSYESREKQWRNRFDKSSGEYAMFVAENEKGQIIGFADGGKERSEDFTYDGELYAIYLLEEYQRQGVGTLLFHHVVTHLKSNKFKQMLIWVLDDNPARHFYESMGGQQVHQQIIQIGNQRLQESAYGWNLDSLHDGL